MLHLKEAATFPGLVSLFPIKGTSPSIVLLHHFGFRNTTVTAHRIEALRWKASYNEGWGFVVSAGV